MKGTRVKLLIFLHCLLGANISFADIYEDRVISFQTITDVEQFGTLPGDTLEFYYSFNNQNNNQACQTLDGGNTGLKLFKGFDEVHDFAIPCSGTNQTINWVVPDNLVPGDDYNFAFYYNFRPDSDFADERYSLTTDQFVIGRGRPVVTAPADGSSGHELIPTFTWHDIPEASEYWLIIGDQDALSASGQSLSYSISKESANNAIFETKGITSNSYTLPSGILEYTTNYQWILVSRQFGKWFSNYGFFKTKDEVFLPVASIISNVDSGIEPLTVFFDGSASTSENGAITRFAWSTSDGQSGAGSSISFTFSNAGEYVVTLAVTDSLGETASTVHRIEVEEKQIVEPIASFRASPVSGEAPLTVFLDGSGSSSGNGEITSFDWRTSDGQTAAGSEISLTFSRAGEYAITLTITDYAGESASTTQIISVDDEREAKPVASFSARPEFGEAPLVVFLDASASFDTEGEIVEYQWESSDGKTDNGRIVNMTFIVPGIYEITLTVTNDSGGQTQVTHVIEVTESENQSSAVVYTLNSGELYIQQVEVVSRDFFGNTFVTRYAPVIMEQADRCGGLTFEVIAANLVTGDEGGSDQPTGDDLVPTFSGFTGELVLPVVEVESSSGSVRYGPVVMALNPECSRLSFKVTRAARAD